jgi:hypothetical protein
MRISNDNVVPWRIDMPDRDDNGELVMAPVVFLLRIYTRKELRDRAHARVASAIKAMGEAMARLVAVRPEQADAEDELRAAALAADAAAVAVYDAENVEMDDLVSRIVGWRKGITDAATGAEVPFSETLRDALLADEARYQAVREGLLEASHGARRKNSLPGPAGSPAVAQGGVANGSGETTAAKG